jgi:hypothetical protein
VKIADFNPLKLAQKGINSAIDKLQQSPAAATSTALQPQAPAQPVAPAAVDGEPVAGTFVPSAPATTIQVGSVATMRTEEFRQIVNSFDEDKQTFLALAVSKFFTTLAYLGPLGLGFYAGAAVGDTISGAVFTWAHASNVFYHFISIALELSIPMLGYAVAVSFKRAAKDRSQVGLCAILAVLFICLAIGNALAQDVLLYHNLPQSTTDEQVSIWFRSFGPSIVDVLCTVFLAVVGVRSLRKYLADQREKITAVKDVAAIHIEMDEAELKAEIDKQSAMMDMQSKAKRAATWNEIEAMQAEAMIEQARRNMRSDSDGSSYRRSRY